MDSVTFVTLCVTLLMGAEGGRGARGGRLAWSQKHVGGQRGPQPQKAADPENRFGIDGLKRA